MAAPTDVVDLADARRPNERGKSLDQVEAVNVVAHLFALVAENAIGPAADGAFHEVGEKPVQLGPGMSGSR